MDILPALIKEARRQLIHKGNFRIDNIILGKTLYTMKGCDEVFTDMNFCLILLENAYGFSYFQEDIDYSLKEYVNRDALGVVKEKIPIYMRVAIIDAMYCLINKTKFNKINFIGNIRQKARERARVLLANIPAGSRILLLGAATEIIEEARRKKCGINVLDLEKQKIGLRFSSTLINNGNKTDLQSKIKDNDYIIATGMIFISDTADRIFKLANINKKPLFLYMETGSNFGPQLLEYGASVVLSEFFPYYDFFGKTEYQLFKNKQY